MISRCHTKDPPNLETCLVTSESLYDGECQLRFFSQSEVVGVDFHTPHGWEEALKGRPVNLLDSFPIHPKGSFHGRAFNLP